MTITLTARETEALTFIDRKGGGLPGGRENTQVMSRLVKKGMCRWTQGPNTIEVTAAGQAFLAAKAGA